MATKAKKVATGYIMACGNVIKSLSSIGSEESVTCLGLDLKVAQQKIKDGTAGGDDGDVIYEITVKRIGEISYGFQFDEEPKAKKKK